MGTLSESKEGKEKGTLVIPKQRLEVQEEEEGERDGLTGIRLVGG